MLSRRVFAGCGLCAALSLVAESVDAQAPTGGVTRTILSRTGVAGSRYETVQVSAVVDAGANVARHTHPGTESTFVLDGEAVLVVAGKPDQALKPGDGFFIEEGVPHAVRNGPRPLRLAATYVVDRDRPLAAPAPE